MQTLINILGWMMLIQLVLLVIGLVACYVFKKPLHPDYDEPRPKSDPRAFLAGLVELTSGDADWVAVLPVNEDAAKIEHQRAIDVNAEWTGYEDKRFFGETLEEAVRAALKARNEWQREREASPA